MNYEKNAIKLGLNLLIIHNSKYQVSSIKTKDKRQKTKIKR